jgi:UTP--glucose-1-phosphate uridylyltransferase
MGAAIESFPGARILEVPRTRFVPVKTTNDLLVIRSDVYSLREDMVVEPVNERLGRLPYVDLDREIYGLLDRFDAHFPAGPPSLRKAERLVVRGEVSFGADVVVQGTVELEAAQPLRIGDGSTLCGAAETARD